MQDRRIDSQSRAPASLSASTRDTDKAFVVWRVNADFYMVTTNRQL